MAVVSLKLPDALHGRLAGAAERFRRSKSAIIREALERYLDGVEGSSSGSVYDIVSDLVGSVEGPRDLSTNPRYLRDFGK